ncbi:MAG: hypothetical protein GF329_14390 [Candidatus Lokiarchaeota archaeon]|nr:hypothetical protein [Candidatus Lokiarchaeota archaeon]
MTIISWKKRFLIILMGFLLLFPLVIGFINYPKMKNTAVLNRVANYTMKEMDFSFGTWGKGIMMEGLLHAYNLTNDNTYLDFVKYWTDQSIRTQTQNGVFTHGETTVGDATAIGISVLYFYELTNDSYYLDAAVRNMEFLLMKPPITSEGGISHRMSSLELWIDTVHMICPFLARLGIILENDTIVDEAVNQIFIHDKYLRDNNTGLYSHIWNHDPSGPNDPFIWSRGIGWMTTAIVELLEIIPPSHPNRTGLISLLKNCIPKISALQDSETGLWHTIMNDSSTGLETSCAELFAYSIALSVERGWIQDNGNKSVAINAYNGVINKVDDYGVVIGVSGGTGWDSYGAPIYQRAISWGQGLFIKMYRLFEELGW